MSFPFKVNSRGGVWWSNGSISREMTGGEECSGCVQGKHAPWGLFNLFPRTMQSPNLSIGRLIHELKLRTVHGFFASSVWCSLVHMFVK